MKNMVIVAALVVVGGLSLGAQTLLYQVDLAAFGYANHDVRPVEADGNPATQEFLAIPREFNGLYQVGAVGPAGQICRGSWFNPRFDWSGAMVSAPVREGTVDVLIVRPTTLFGGVSPSAQRVVGLIRPVCG